jgi:hypothetical protein
LAAISVPRNRSPATSGTPSINTATSS